MPRFPGGDAAAKRAAELVANIHVLVHKHTEPFVRDRAEEQAKALASDPEALREVLRALAKQVRDDGGTLDDIRQAVTQAKRALTDVDVLIMMATVEVVPTITGAWMQTLMVRVRPGKGLALLRADQLDDAMLPPGDDVNAYFDQFFAESPIDGDLAREVLRTVKKSLPDGKRLPDDVVEFFGLRKIYVVSP